MAVLLELARLPHGEVAGEVAIDDVLGFDVLAIHERVRVLCAARVYPLSFSHSLHFGQ